MGLDGGVSCRGGRVTCNDFAGEGISYGGFQQPFVGCHGHNRLQDEGSIGLWKRLNTQLDQVTTEPCALRGEGGGKVEKLCGNVQHLVTPYPPQK